MTVTTDESRGPEPPASRAAAEPHRVGGGLFDPKMLVEVVRRTRSASSTRGSWSSPRSCSWSWSARVLTTVSRRSSDAERLFAWTIAVWLWLTVLFANLAEAVAEGRGKAQADTLRRARTDTVARRLIGADGDRSRSRCPAPQLQPGRPASWSRPATSSPATATSSRASPRSTSRPSPASRRRSSASPAATASAVTGGTTVLSDRIVVQITTKPGETFIDRMIALVEGAARQKTPNEIALNILLASPDHRLPARGRSPCRRSRIYSGRRSCRSSCWSRCWSCLIPTTIGALLSAIGIAGMDRLVQRNVLAMSRPGGRGGRRRHHPAARQDRHHHPRQPAGRRVRAGRRGRPRRELADAAQLSSLADETPEGRSIVVLAKEKYGLRERHEGELAGAECVAVHRPDPHVRASTWPTAGRSARARPARSATWIRVSGGTSAGRPRPDGRPDLRGRRHPAGGRRAGERDGPGTRRHPPQGRRQGGHRASGSTSCARWASGPS